MRDTMLFLDFDGVIRTGRTKAKLDPDAVAQLNRLLALTQAEVVVSSSWRQETVAPMRTLLQAWGVWARVRSITPRLDYYIDRSPFVISVTREQEILAWMAKHGTPERFVILDDEADGFDRLRPWLIHTDFEVGLTAQDVERAAARLRGTC